MDIVECKDVFGWVIKINDWLSANIDRYNAKRIFLPAGETPRPLYKNWEECGAPFSQSTCLVQIDEIISGAQSQAFQLFFKESLPSFKNQFEYIDEAGAYADLAILGIGANGHVAFHEPGLSSSFYSGCLTLNEDTIKRNRLYPGVKIVTYGVQAFLQAKAILIIARGEAKKSILQEVLKSSCNLPAAELKIHKNLTIITDFNLD